MSDPAHPEVHLVRHPLGRTPRGWAAHGHGYTGPITDATVDLSAPHRCTTSNCPHGSHLSGRKWVYSDPPLSEYGTSGTFRASDPPILGTDPKDPMHRWLKWRGKGKQTEQKGLLTAEQRAASDACSGSNYDPDKFAPRIDPKTGHHLMYLSPWQQYMMGIGPPPESLDKGGARHMGFDIADEKSWGKEGVDWYDGGRMGHGKWFDMGDHPVQPLRNPNAWKQQTRREDIPWGLKALVMCVVM
ncbi:hypothetical protein MMC18_002433 [Xylographa bjoerkii]|nr:hypothetical protein [Xylographa bjoerkii]